ncbi:MAG: helix-turn-helix transcriptional regulator [Anaerolineales bacterium]
MERKLLLLGLLRQQEMYGYQINDLIDIHLGSSINLTKPTAYRLLHIMTEQGWITFRDEQVGKRPTRRIYSLTESGEIQFQKYLKRCLVQYEPTEYRSTVCLAFLDTLPKEEAILLLKERHNSISEKIASMNSNESHHGSFQLTIDHQIRHLETDLEWLAEVIDRLESSDGELGDEIYIHPPSQPDVKGEDYYE